MYLGEEYVNNKTLADVTFVVEGRHFHAHRIALLASSDAFRAMFDSGYREREAACIDIPNIPYDVFGAMMHYIYTGQVRGSKAPAGHTWVWCWWSWGAVCDPAAGMHHAQLDDVYVWLS